VTQDGHSIDVASKLADEDAELLRSLGELADDLGTRAYAVGGLVRDLLLGLPNLDLDVVVEGDAVSFAEAAAERLGGSVKTHTRFGTVILALPGRRKVDLATSRSEVYDRPGALPTVTPGPMVDDLRRRDFTVNAMAIELAPESFGELLDPHGGRADLRHRVLRVMTDVSFEDDPTRVLRGVRFSARFGLAIDATTEALMRRAIEERRTDTVSGERLANEIELILKEEDPWPPVFRLIDWGILPSLVEGWDVPLSVRESVVAVAGMTPWPPARADGVARGAREAAGDGSPERWVSLLLALLWPVPSSTRSSVVERLAMGRRVRESVGELTVLEGEVLPELSGDAEPDPSRLFELLHGLTPEVTTLARAVATGPAAERMERFESELRGTTTALSGSDLREMGVPEGPRIGEILSALLGARLNGAVTSDDEERELARRLVGSLTNEARVDSVSREPGTPESKTEAAPEAKGMQHDERPENPAAGSTPETAAVATAGAEAAPADLPGDAGGSAHTTAEDEPTLVRRPVYEVRLEAFEGPLDLLLHLIREHEIDIYDIPIAIITEQYLEYISFMESLDLALAGEFLEMAATLIRIKVQMLLPKETDEEEEEDPREQLVRKLVEYKQFKEVAGRLSEQEKERRDYFPRGVDPKSYVDFEEEEMDIEEFLRDVTLFDLVDSLREVLSRVPERVDVHSVDMETVTVEEQIDLIRTVMSERSSIPFAEVFGDGAGRFEIIATFIALLELIRLGEVRAVQKRNFGDIEIQARVEE